MNLEELERLEREATPGPWRQATWSAGFDDRGVSVMDNDGCRETDVAESEKPCDAALIAAARNALPDLLAELRALRAVAEAAEAHVDHFGDDTYDAIVNALDAWRGLR